MKERHDSPHNLPLVVALLVAAVAPLGAGFAFAQQVTQHPWYALGIAVVYELLVGAVGIATNVSKQLQKRWEDRLTEWLDLRLQWLISGYYQRYRRSIRYEHRDIDVKGLSFQGPFALTLDEVFVELTVDPRPPDQASSALIPALPQALRKGHHSIWAFLAAQPVTNEATPHFVILGAPGIGKTTLLKHMALTLVAGRRGRRKWKAPPKLPLLLSLRDHAEAISTIPDYSLVTGVQEHLKKWNRPAPAGWIERQLAQGRCLVLLDGLDEVANPALRQNVVDWVQRQMIAYGENRFVLTSRPFGYRSLPNLLSGVTVLEVCPFNHEQIEHFAHKWYFANEHKSAQKKEDEGVRVKAREGAQDLLRRLRNTPALQELAINPLLLTMIATIHRYHNALPGRRVELYAQICEVFLGRRQESRGIALDMTAAQKQLILQPLAYHLMCAERREIASPGAAAVIQETLHQVNPQIAGEAFLHMVEESSGLLLEKESGVYGFAHLTFQEYLAAMYVREKHLEQELVTQVEREWWHETIRLYCAQVDATPIIQACLAGDRPSIQALALAVECSNEARNVQLGVRNQLEAIQAQWLEDSDPERRRIAAEVRLSRRLKSMERSTEDQYVDTSFITCAEYQLFLNDPLVEERFCQPEHWLSTRFPAGKGREPVLGVSPSDTKAFCTWLTKREPGGQWSYRLLKTDDSLPKILPGEQRQGIGYWFQSGKWVDFRHIGKQEQANTFAPLVKWLEDDFRDMPLNAAFSHLSNIFALDAPLDSAFVLDSTIGITLALVDQLARYGNLSIPITSAGILDSAKHLSQELTKISFNTSFNLGELPSEFPDDLVSAIASVRSLADTLSSTHSLSSILQQANELPGKIASAPNPIIARELILQFARELSQASHHSLFLDLASASTRDIQFASQLAHALAHASERAVQFAATLDNPSHLATIFSVAREAASKLVGTTTYNTALAQAKDVVFHLYYASKSAQTYNPSQDLIALLAALRRYIRLAVLILAEIALTTSDVPSPESRQSLKLNRKGASSAGEEPFDDVSSACLDLYIKFIILEERIAGTLQPVEGILIVKERAS